MDFASGLWETGELVKADVLVAAIRDDLSTQIREALGQAVDPDERVS